MKRTERVGIGNFVMRGQEYLVAIVSDNGVLRADTLRYADEIRSPRSIGLPVRAKPSSRLVNQFTKEIVGLKRNDLSLEELEDKESEQLQALVKAKKKNSDSIIHQQEMEPDDAGTPDQSAQVIDLTALLRRSLSKRVVVTNAQGSAPISLDERRALRSRAIPKTAAKRK